MEWTTGRKAAVLGGAALVVFCVVQSRRRYAEHNGSICVLDPDLPREVRRVVMIALEREHDARVLHALGQKLDAAGYRTSARVVQDRAGAIVGAGHRVGQVSSAGSGAVASAQRALQKFGYDVAADGVLGPRTRDAIMKFQSLHDLDIDGLPGPATMAALRAGGL